MTTIAFNQGIDLGVNAWNTHYQSIGYSAGDMVDVLDASDTLEPLLAANTNAVFLIPRTSGPSAPVSSGAINGKIIDSTTAQPLANVVVTAYPFGANTLTDANGDYAFPSLPVTGVSSPYRLSATLTGYDPDFRLVTVVPDGTTTANIPLNPILSSQDAYRIVLEWAQDPRDLDSHVWTPSGAHVYYVDRGSLAAQPFVNLDVDDVTSYGPETVTIRELKSGTYTYAIHHFAGSGTLAGSSARVKVYDQTGPIRLFTVPTGGTGIWWTAFTIDGSSGVITPVNTIRSSPPIPF